MHEYIAIRPGRRESVVRKDGINAVAEKGLEGDHYQSKGDRQVTLIQQEHITAVSGYLGKNIDPDLLRRNIVVSGINLLSLKGKRFRLGKALLEYLGECHPCFKNGRKSWFGRVQCYAWPRRNNSKDYSIW
jgi:MOSC domain-containing protein YiiM